jgi:undecaprenyl-diphosphatase
MSSPAHSVKAPRRPVSRRRDALILAALGLLLSVLSALPVREHSLDPVERDVFRAVNTHTVAPFLVVWVIMQLGNIVVVPVAAIVAAIARRWWLSAGLFIGGVAVYVLAKVVKGAVVRGRPASLIPDVRIRGAEPLGRGYPSGHAAVVTLIVVLAWPYLRRRGRIVAVTLATVVCLARMYVGAHLPLDIIGGMALGLLVGGALRFVGTPAR